MLCAGARDSSRSDLAGRRDKLLEKLDIFVVDMVNLVLSEIADFVISRSSLEHGYVSFLF